MKETGARIVARTPILAMCLSTSYLLSKWDSKLRQRYCNWIFGTVFVLSACVFALGLLNGMSLQKFVLAVMAPLLPAGLWAAREWRRQSETALESDRQKDDSESLWGQ